MPFFSVIIPLYNRESRISRTLDSLRSQTFQDFETIIVDDASIDNSYNVSLTYELPNKIVLKNEKNSERCVTRNRGISIAQGQYICFLDSDDYHLPTHLQTLYKAIEELHFPKAFFFTNAYDETENGIRSERFCPNYDDISPYTYFLRYTVNPQRWAVHHSIAKPLLFDPNIVIAEDMDFTLRVVAKQIPIYQIKERTTVYVAANDSFTHADTQKPQKELLYFKKIFAKQELQGKLPRKEMRRLLSMCHFNLAKQYFAENQKWVTFWRALYSCILFPQGYNGKTNRQVFVMCIYSIPIIGCTIRGIVKFCKL